MGGNKICMHKSWNILEQIFRRPRRSWEDSIKMGLRRICCEMDGTNLVGFMSSDGL
jgi:hypothetical protein